MAYRRSGRAEGRHTAAGAPHTATGPQQPWSMSARRVGRA